MIETLLQWIESMDWNCIIETAISYSYILYFLPVPFLIFGLFYLLKVLGIHSTILSFLLSIFITIPFFYIHKNQFFLIHQEVDFYIVKIVALEYIAGAMLFLTTIILSGFKAIFKKQKRSPA